jgi:hypothetical protein
MFLLSTHDFGLSTNPDGRSSLSMPVPMIYEQHQPLPVRWEYHVLTVDAAEVELPGVERLNELGRDGWIFVGVLDERASGKGTHVYYYFTRQAMDEK